MIHMLALNGAAPFQVSIASNINCHLGRKPLAGNEDRLQPVGERHVPRTSQATLHVLCAQAPEQSLIARTADKSTPFGINAVLAHDARERLFRMGELPALL